MAGELTLDAVVQALHDSKINAGVQTFYQHQWTVWLGDSFNGYKESGYASSTAEAATWLDAKAREFYPESDYAKARVA
jgi:hypothetical protein